MSRGKSMGELNDILLRLRQGHGIRRIQRETGIHRNVIRKLRAEAEEHGWLCAEHQLPDDQTLYEIHYGPAPAKAHPLDPLKDKIKFFLDEGTEVVSMRRELRNEYSGSLSQLYRYIHKQFPGTVKQPIVREKERSVMEVDYGYLGLVIDEETGRKRKLKFFSGRLRCSRHAYREPVFDERHETFFTSHMKAFGFFGGVPKRVVMDNLKAAVIKAALYDTVVNRGYYDLAKHYGFLIDPCRARKPEHKGGVENDVKYVKRSFWRPFLARRKLAGLGIPTFREVTDALRAWEREVASVRTIASCGRTVEDLFEEERESLQQLPAEPYETLTWKRCRVSKGFVRYNTSAYSVAPRFEGKEVLLAAGSLKVRVFHEYELVCEHKLSQKRYQQVILPEHESIRLRLYRDSDRLRLIERAALIGPATHEVMESILSDNVIYGIRPAWGVLSLAKKYSTLRLEAACRRALDYEMPRYRNVKAILEKGLDHTTDEDTVDSRGQYHFTFARERGYFAATHRHKEVL
jgi:transposase